MKKLNLKNLKLGENDMLQRDQLKTVFGGYLSEDIECKDECTASSDCPQYQWDCNTYECDPTLGTTYKMCGPM